ncbi:MAG: zinc-dependent alcohol dehydrogenase family protein [Gammaproteobacteria bacterium]
MQAMVLEAPGRPLALQTRPVPVPAAHQVSIRVRACGVCRTDLHVLDGDLPGPKLPLILGHEIVGEVAVLGDAVQGLKPGQRVGVPWLGHTCGQCAYCTRGQENLCPEARFHGYQIDGGYGEYTLADARYCFPLPDAFPPEQAAPLLCAGLIGYRALRLAGDGQRLGIYGFGAAGHIVAQLAIYEGKRVFAFTRRGDQAAQGLAYESGATWAGDSGCTPPEPLDAAILFAPVGHLVPVALRAVVKAGSVVCAGIHMSDIPAFPYSILWGERVLRSVANLTRRDGEAFLALAPRVPIRATVETYPLAQANEALARLRAGRVQGAAVLMMD